MPVVLALVFVIVGTVLGLVSARQIVAANHDTKIPWSGRMPNHPRNAPLLRGVGGALAIVGGLGLYPVLDAGVIAVVFVTTACPLLVFVAHNRRIERTAKRA